MFIIINLSNDDKATIVATSLVTPDLMAQDGFTIQDSLKIPSIKKNRVT